MTIAEIFIGGVLLLLAGQARAEGDHGWARLFSVLGALNLALAALAVALGL